MATPTSLPAAFVTGAVLTAAQQNDLRGAFRVLQVVSATTSTPTSATIVAFVDSTLTVTITPQSNTSKIFVMVNQSLFVDTAQNISVLRLLRGATVLQSQSSPIFSSAGNIAGNGSFMYLDSPATTSAITYKTQIAINTGVGTVTAQINSNPANITVFEISA
jgi:hypothetical protein